MSEVKFVVQTADHTRKAELTLDRGLAGGDVMQAAMDNWALPRDTDYSLVNTSTGKALAARQTLGEDTVRDGDVLEVQPMLVAGGRRG
jgi:hypothetical protein